MGSGSSRTMRGLWPLYLACYVLCIAFTLAGAWLIFEARPAMFALAARLRLNPWQVRAVDEFSVVTLGLIWLIGILWMEHYLRQGVPRNRLWRRAARVLLIEVVVWCIFFAMRVSLA